MTVIRRAGPVDGDIYAKAGEASCCENGHLLALLVRDVKFGATPVEEDFKFMRDGVMGAEKCPECGGAMDTDGGMFFLVAGA